MLTSPNPVLSTLVAIVCPTLLFSPFVFALASAALPDRRIQRSRDLAEGLLACKQLLDAGAITAEDFGQMQADFAVEMEDQRRKSIVPELVVGIGTVVIVATIGAAFGLPFFISLF